jgi:uncharacterized membrane protein
MNAWTTQMRSTLICAAERINTALERHLWLWTFPLLISLLICSLVGDVRRKVWTDEIVTIIMARQADATEIVRATREGLDNAPPAYAILAHALLPFFHSESLAARLPSTLGYFCMPWLVLAFCRRRMPAVYALAAAMMCLVACRYYATEARAYGVVLGCAAGALLSWQAVSENRRRGPFSVLLALCLALMTAAHYYSIFFLIPLGVAELVRWSRTRKFDWLVFTAMVRPCWFLDCTTP